MESDEDIGGKEGSNGGGVEEERKDLDDMMATPIMTTGV